MYIKKYLKIFLAIFILIILFLITSKSFNKENLKKLEINKSEESSFSSNIITEVNFVSKDSKGNKYIVDAIEGEVDFSNNKIIYLKKIRASVELNNLTKMIITADFGKYNTENFNAIFSENVVVKYLDNKISSEYVDFSAENNLMTISRNVVFSNSESILKADVIEMDIYTKDAKIYMHDHLKKVKIKNKN